MQPQSVNVKRLILISCCGEKLPRVARARDLYRSQLFRKSVAWAEAQSGDWMVISARHGLIRPDDQLAPYDCTMRDLTPDERDRWARRVAMSLEALMLCHDADRLEVALLAGESYAGWVSLVQTWCTVHQPLGRMQIGQRLQWLTEQQMQGDMFREAA